MSVGEAFRLPFIEFKPFVAGGEVSLRLGHARGLTPHRGVIQDPRVASLPLPYKIQQNAKPQFIATIISHTRTAVNIQLLQKDYTLVVFYQFDIEKTLNLWYD